MVVVEFVQNLFDRFVEFLAGLFPCFVGGVFDMPGFDLLLEVLEFVCLLGEGADSLSGGGI